MLMRCELHKLLINQDMQLQSKSTWQPYKDFFREDFHPWQQDTHQLIEDWELQQQS